MSILLAPAVSILNRLRFPKKFMLMGFLTMLAMVVLLYSLFVSLNESITASRKELEGSAVIRPLMKLVQDVQQHRGLSASIINGAADLEPKRKGKQADVDKSVAALDPMLPPTLRDSADWKKIKADWIEIAGQGIGWTSPKNFAAHVAIIDKLLYFQQSIADESGLMLDPEAATYYLMDTAVVGFPGLLEYLGQIRARGAAALSKREVSNEMRVNLGYLQAAILESTKKLERNVEKTAKYQPEVSAPLKEAVRNIKTTITRVNEIISNDLLEEKFVSTPKEYFEMVTGAIDGGYNQLYQTMLPTLDKLIEERIARLQAQMMANLAIALVLVGLIVYLQLGILYATRESFAKIIEGAREISGGNLKERIAIDTRDELSDLAGSFNDMAGSIGQLIARVQADADKLATAARDLSGASEEIAHGSMQQSEAATSMAASVEQMTVGIDHISKNSVDAHALSGESGELSREGARIVGDVVTEIDRIASSMRQSADLVGELGQQSEKISDIVNVIQDIADQTNLLALNAAIEAARAGEAGRGFAVVADEVRKLAERTSKSTGEITAMVTSIQNGTTAAVGSMKEGVARVEAGVGQAREAGDAMRQIQDKAQQSADMVSDISSSLREQSAASTEIARNVEHIAQMSERNNAAVRQNAETASDLERLAGGLRNEVSRFKV